MSVETSIIIRTLNEARHLEKLLKGIHEQNYHDWEIILVDSGSTDGSLEIASRYGARIFHIPQPEFTFGRSLNLGCREAVGRYLVFASGHVWPITNNWLRNMTKPFVEDSVGMVFGRQRGTEASRLSEHRDLHVNYGSTSNITVDEAKGNNGNAAIRRDLWLNQPFDESLPGLEDVDWARKVETKGYRVYYAADAAVYHEHDESLRQVYRRHLREAIASKRMFPGYRVSWSDVARGLPYFIARDFLYAIRQRKPGKVFQIPTTRLAQFMGIYNGVRHQKSLAKTFTRHLRVPPSYQRLVIEEPGRHGLQDTKFPQPKPDQVAIQVAYTAVCGADFQMAREVTSNCWNGGHHYPIVPGHQFSGIVVGAGAKAQQFGKGQKVAGECHVGCGHCPACTAGDVFCCSGSMDGGTARLTGAYSQYLMLPSNRVHKLPLDMPLKHGALVGAIALCLEGLSRMEISVDHHVCVAGAGSIGNLCSQILRNRGVRVTVVDTNPKWLSLLYKYDVDTLTAIGPLDKYDLLIDCVGNTELVRLFVEQAKSSSRALILSSGLALNQESLPSAVDEHKKVSSSVAFDRHKFWRDATRSVQSGIINLDDHTLAIEPLEAYEKVWASVERQEQFNVLLRASEELVAL